MPWTLTSRAPDTWDDTCERGMLIARLPGPHQNAIESLANSSTGTHAIVSAIGPLPASMELPVLQAVIVPMAAPHGLAPVYVATCLQPSQHSTPRRESGL
jgi:hypothetical protein